jgi:diaminohydroxyphosphoribosylaminopyrimidine deaminase/5-amino-6-(5-phosphoribosylamino)uracil reductase
MRLILSSSGNLKDGYLVQDSDENVIVFTHNPGAGFEWAYISLLDPGEPSCVQIVKYLYSKGVQSLFIEGGAEVINHFITNDLWDEARVFSGNDAFSDGLIAPSVAGLLISEEKFEGSSLHVYINENVKDLYFKI